jgi:hypothetical protein
MRPGKNSSSHAAFPSPHPAAKRKLVVIVFDNVSDPRAFYADPDSNFSRMQIRIWVFPQGTQKIMTSNCTCWLLPDPVPGTDRIRIRTTGFRYRYRFTYGSLEDFFPLKTPQSYSNKIYSPYWHPLDET